MSKIIVPRDAENPNAILGWRNKISNRLRNISDDGNMFLSVSVSSTVLVDQNVKIIDTFIPVDASSGSVTLTLFTAVGNSGRIVIAKKIDSSANAMIITGSEPIDGVATKSTTTQYVSISFLSDGAKWNII